jgi:hypothetical protein
MSSRWNSRGRQVLVAAATGLAAAASGDHDPRPWDRSPVDARAFAEPLRLSALAFMIRRSILDPMRRAGRERATTAAFFSGFQADVSPAGLSRQ